MLKFIRPARYIVCNLQSLFHIPKFRRLILNYSPSKVLSAVSIIPLLQGDFYIWWLCFKNSVSALFVRELRKLFALMVASKRKYVDPSTVLEVLKESFVAGSEVFLTDTMLVYWWRHRSRARTVSNRMWVSFSINYWTGWKMPTDLPPITVKAIRRPPGGATFY